MFGDESTVIKASYGRPLLLGIEGSGREAFPTVQATLNSCFPGFYLFIYLVIFWFFFIRQHYPELSAGKMGEPKFSDEGGGATVISSSIDPVVVVSEGTGKTANIEGAKAREVHNVSNRGFLPFEF